MALLTARPTKEIGWAKNIVANGPSSGNNRVDYTIAYRDQGYAWKEKPPREYENAWKYNIYCHLAWAGDEIEGLESRLGNVETNVSSVTVVTTTTVIAQSTVKLLVDVSVAAQVITFPGTPVTGQEVLIATKGNAALYNVTVQGNGRLINGVANYLMDLERVTTQFIYDGSAWQIGLQTAKTV